MPKNLHTVLVTSSNMCGCDLEISFFQTAEGCSLFSSPSLSSEWILADVWSPAGTLEPQRQFIGQDKYRWVRKWEFHKCLMVLRRKTSSSRLDKVTCGLLTCSIKRKKKVVRASAVFHFLYRGDAKHVPSAVNTSPSTSPPTD